MGVDALDRLDHLKGAPTERAVLAKALTSLGKHEPP